MNIKEIATTLAFLGTGSLVAMGCGKEPAPATEVPGGSEAAPADTAGEASCAEGHTEEGHCGDSAAEAGAEGEGEGDEAAGEGSCSGEGAEGEGSCSGK